MPRKLPEAGHAVQSRVLSASCIIIQSGRWTGRARPDGVRTPRRITAVRIVSQYGPEMEGRQAGRGSDAGRERGLGREQTTEIGCSLPT